LAFDVFEAICYLLISRTFLIRRQPDQQPFFNFHGLKRRQKDYVDGRVTTRLPMTAICASAVGDKPRSSNALLTIRPRGCSPHKQLFQGRHQIRSRHRRQNCYCRLTLDRIRTALQKIRNQSVNFYLREIEALEQFFPLGISEEYH
jgi:hypothetical protein